MVDMKFLFITLK